MAIFSLICFILLTLLLAFAVAWGLWRWMNDVKKYGKQAKEIKGDFSKKEKRFIVKLSYLTEKNEKQNQETQTKG
ncbi:hypothetical protein [Spiroplasma endosymbiont of Clivina fossor]|uniref:hypothetical protein n=1 Tax=Spiroplasma endosymbiont of Clivina fossor TaxID=3066282 RepID=UPI00313AE3E7